MKKTIKLSIILMIFATFSCSVSTEKESILPQNRANTPVNLTKSARKNPIVNTITLTDINNPATIGNLSTFVVSFDSENEKGINEAGFRHTPFHNKYCNYVLDQSGTILTELSPGDVAQGNPTFKPGQPIGGIIVKGGRNPGGQIIEMKTNENGEIKLPKEWLEGEFLIQIESKTQNSIFVLTIGKEKIEKVDAPNMLVNQDGTIRNFYYEKDFQLHSDIAKDLGAEAIIIEKGFYRVGQSKWGNVNLKVKNGGKITGSIIIQSGNARLYEGTNPKGIDCKGFGIACFYIAETGIDKKDKLYYMVKPIIEKETLIGVEISEAKKGLNAVNVGKGITQSGIK